MPAKDKYIVKQDVLIHLGFVIEEMEKDGYGLVSWQVFGQNRYESLNGLVYPTENAQVAILFQRMPEPTWPIGSCSDKDTKLLFSLG